MTTETPPDDWVLLKGARLSEYDTLHYDAKKLRETWDWQPHSFRALCYMIAKYEKP